MPVPWDSLIRMSLNRGDVAYVSYVLLQLAERDPEFTPSDAVASSESSNGFFASIIERAAEHDVDVSVLHGRCSESIPAIDDAFGRRLNATDPADYGLSGQSGWNWVLAVWIQASTEASRDQDVTLA
ncbi:hypothetical protein NS234_01880 [Microbacterium oxydans]|nr:hypothetical protein NS234_01880 [Microbacterium oxydans]